ncbi:glycosyltransferase family 61 protein, partial [Geitlerinema sp. P-1104]|uniref:glycosyltransferase family 61 protein n=1 Tax=Geitlerinema sp. P-1104 TaxID=2546230 RepID=UPI0014772803
KGLPLREGNHKGLPLREGNHKGLPLREGNHKGLPLRYPQGWFPKTQSALDRGVRRYEVTPVLGGDYLQDNALSDSPQPPGPQLKACQGVNCQTCLNRLQEQFAPVALRENQYHCPPGTKPLPLQTAHFTAEIAQGRIWTMPQKHWWHVCEAIAVMTRDDYLLADLSREYPGELPGCSNRHLNPGQHRIFNRVQLPPVDTVEGTVAVLTGLSANVYFHWMVDVLPRLDILRCSGFPEAEIDWFYVNSIAKPFQRDTLERLGIPGDRILESDRHPHLQATRLVVPSFAGPIGWATGESIEFLRSQFLPSQPSPAPISAKRLYISRKTAQYRRVINEPQLMQRLQQQGFQVIALENYSVTEQAQLFANAELIVAPHGAGLTNLVFCQGDTKVVELFSPNYIRYYYWSICQYLKLNHYYLVGSALPCSVFRHLLYPDVLTEDFWVDIESVEELIKETP